VKPSASWRAALLGTLWLAAPAGATTLDEAIAAAMAHSPAVAMAASAGDAADARLEQARAATRPTATLSGTIGYGRLDMKQFFGLGAENVTPRAAMATIEQPLFTGGRAAAARAQARAGQAAAEAGKLRTRGDLAAQVAQAYGGVLTAARMRAMAGELVAQTTEIERQARLRFRAGESPSTDVAQATARAAEARAILARAEGGAALAEAQYRNLVGVAPEALEPLPQGAAVPESLDAAIAEAQAANPARAAAVAALAAARAVAAGARADRLPTAGAFAEASMVRDQFFPDYSANAATVGVRARWQLYSGGRVGGRISEASAEVRSAEAALRAADQQLEADVISAFQDVRTQAMVRDAADAQALAAAEALAAVGHEVRVGMKPQLAQLDAARENIAAAAAQAQARADAVVARYRLAALLGR